MRPLLVLLALAWILTAKGQLEIADTAASYRTAEALVTAGRLDIPHHESWTLRAADGRSYAKFGIGIALLYVPLVALAVLLAPLTGFGAEHIAAFLISFAMIPFALMTVLLFARLLEGWGIARPRVLLLALGLGLGTLVWRYAVYDFSEAAQGTLVLMAYAGVVERSRAGALAGGAGFAWLLLLKVAHVVLLPLFVAFLALDTARRRGDLAWFLGPVAAAAALLAGLGHARFGNLFETGYGSEAARFSLAQLVHTVPAMLVSLDKGLLVFCPVLLLGILGWPAFARRRPREAALAAALIVGNLLVAGAWYDWDGGWSWGPRFLVPLVPLWLAPAAFWLKEAPSPWRFRIAAFVVGVSILAQVPGVLVEHRQVAHLRESLAPPGERPWTLADPPAAALLLGRKLAGDGEVYRASSFGVGGGREADHRSIPRFQGLAVWTDLYARRFDLPWLRWLALAGAAACAALGVVLFRRVAVS